ncbi:MAG TPA: M3 family metallopeptidase [Thermomicrobiales bacterium]|nr:M3 family metallopeptidase [Thermomicrobiales bacterium]
MSGATTHDLPRWDLTTIYPGVDSDEYIASVERLGSLVDNLETLLGEAEVLDPTNLGDVVPVFERIIVVFNESLGLARHNRWYLQAHLWTDSRDTAAQARMSELQAIRTRRAIAETRFIAWLGGIDVEALVAVSAEAAAHAFLLRQARISAGHQMDPPREALAAGLQESGGLGWSRLQDTIASQVMVTIEMPDGEAVQMSMAETARYSVDPDRDMRRRAYNGRAQAWHLWREPFAAALNGVKGEHIILARERGWASILDESLFQNRMGRGTLDAMFAACRRCVPEFQRFLKAKARALGIDQLAWYDLWVPIPGGTRTWPWDASAGFVVAEFESYSAKLGGLARRALAERWIDAEPRAGKDGGGVCLPLNDGSSRVLLNHIGSFDDVIALGHELGHAYHNLCDAAVTPWRRESRPTILAETASTFCETLIARAAVAGSGEADRLAMLDASLMAATLSIPEMVAAYEFEQTVIERRAERELSADEFSSLFREAREAVYGDALDPENISPHAWEGIPHFYMPWKPFYNYPYTFGLLFGLGLYAMYQDDADTFRRQFDELLTSTGDADAVTLTRRFGMDIQSPTFWESSLDVIRADINVFVDLVDRQETPASTA